MQDVPRIRGAKGCKLGSSLNFSSYVTVKSAPGRKEKKKISEYLYKKNSIFFQNVDIFI